MKRLLLLIFAAMITMSGCNSSVSEKEYEALQLERDTLNQKYVEIEKKYKELSDINSQLQEEKEEAENSYNEYLNKYSDLVTKSFQSGFIGAWGKVIYGDNIQYAQFGDDAVQLNVLKERITKDSILDFYNKLMDNASTLATMTSNVDYIYVRLLDENYAPVLEFFINQSDENNLLISSSIGYEYFNIVSETLNTLIQ